MKAVVIGSGPNGLTGAIILARAGFEVVVHEAADQLGGGMRTAELTLPGFRHDLCSSIHPLGRGSPAFRELGLELDWVEPPIEAAHPFDDGSAAVLERSLDATAERLGSDAAAYRRLFGPLVRAWDVVEPVLVGPYPPSLRQVAAVLRKLPPRFPLAALATARSLAESELSTPHARALFAGHAAHSMLPMERRPSAGFGMALLVMGHVVGWPFPRGGSQAIADALAAELRRLGGDRKSVV